MKREADLLFHLSCEEQRSQADQVQLRVLKTESIIVSKIKKNYTVLETHVRRFKRGSKF
jgi:hypothetical protein